MTEPHQMIDREKELEEYNLSCTHHLMCKWMCTAMGCPYHSSAKESSDKVLDAKKEFLTKIIEKIRSEFTLCDDDEYYLSVEIFEDNVVDVLKQELEDEEELRTKER